MRCETIVNLERFAAAQALLYPRGNFRLVLGMNVSLKGGERSIKTVCRVSMDILHVGRPLHRIRCDVPGPNADLAGFKRNADILDIRNASGGELGLIGRGGTFSEFARTRHGVVHLGYFPSRILEGRAASGPGIIGHKVCSAKRTLPEAPPRHASRPRSSSKRLNDNVFFALLTRSRRLRRAIVRYRKAYRARPCAGAGAGVHRHVRRHNRWR